MLGSRVLDDVVELLDFSFLLLNCLLSFFVVFNLCIQTDLNKVSFLDGHAMIEVLSSKSLVLRLNFLLKLSDLVLRNLELSVEFSNVILSFQEIFGVKIFFRTDSFIQVLLLLELSFKLDVLFPHL